MLELHKGRGIYWPDKRLTSSQKTLLNGVGL